MRTLGRTLLGSAIVALLLSVTAAGVMAQDDGSSMAEEDWAVVTGESRQGGCDGGVCLFTDLMNDPRVSGEGEAPIDIGCSPTTDCWMGGDASISNDGGTWEGRWVGFIIEGGTHEFMSWLQGTGDYEGWSYINLYNDFEGDTIWDVHGVLYRGDLPPSVADGLLALAE